MKEYTLEEIAQIWVDHALYFESQGKQGKSAEDYDGIPISIKFDSLRHFYALVNGWADHKAEEKQ